MTHWNEAFEAVCSGSLDVSPMLGPTVTLDEVPDALLARAQREWAGPHHREAVNAPRNRRREITGGDG